MEVEIALHGHLQDQQDAEDLVADTLVRGREAFGEDVAEAGEALADVVVGTAEVED